MKPKFKLTSLFYLLEMASPVAAGSGSLALAGFPLVELKASLSSHPAPSLLPLQSLLSVSLCPLNCDSSSQINTMQNITSL